MYAFALTDYNLQEPFHDLPNGIVTINRTKATNNRAETLQITENTLYKSWKSAIFIPLLTWKSARKHI